MIKRLTCKNPDRLPMRVTAGEHQCRLGRRMRTKHRKHAALIVMAEMEETVPRQDSGELPLQGKLAHIGDDPFLRREMLPAGIDHGGGRVGTNDGMTKPDQIWGHKRGGPPPQYR